MTVLPQVKNSHLMNAHRRDVLVLFVLDLSAAFDTMNHEILILLRGLYITFRITGHALKRFPPVCLIEIIKV